ncbi:MAG: hypothetical protein JJU41_01855 [Bacteroidetes bacterium]|nr:hypothetical protein [Bacteroidota bacterium]MCH8523624.1 hypothetical protein [Balneolales bacterium]
MFSLHKYSNPVALIFVTLFTVLAGCAVDRPPSDETVIARVGKSYLTLEHALRDIPAFVLEQDSASAVLSYRNDWILSNVIHQEALRTGLNNNEGIHNRLLAAEREVLRQAMREAAIASSPIAITDSEVRDYYNQHRENFVLQERYLRVRHVVTETLDQSRDAKNDLLRGIGWETVVERYALNKEETLEKANQFFPESTLFLDNRLMRDYLRVMGITEISPIRGFQGQYHFIQIMEDRAAGEHPDIEWVFEQIRTWLEMEKRRRTIRIFEQNLVLQAEANNEIQVFDVVQ